LVLKGAYVSGGGKLTIGNDKGNAYLVFDADSNGSGTQITGGKNVYFGAARGYVLSGAAVGNNSTGGSINGYINGSGGVVFCSQYNGGIALYRKQKYTGDTRVLGGVVLMTVGVYFFKIPNGFVTGGVSGIGTVLGKVAPILSTATWITVINIVLLILGFIFVGKETGIKTAYCSLMFSGMSMVLEKIAPITEPLTNQPFLELVYAIMLTAAGSAIMFSQAAS
jgi:hypothetical protein